MTASVIRRLRDVRMADGLTILPCDEVGRAVCTLLVETTKRQAAIDARDVARRSRLSYPKPDSDRFEGVAGASRASKARTKAQRRRGKRYA